MVITFSTELEIAAAPEQVFAAMTDLDAAARWMRGLVRVEKLTEGEFGLGTQFREIRRILGKEATEQFEVTAYDPPRRYGLRLDGADGAPSKSEYLLSVELQPEGPGTRLHATGEVRVPGLVARLLGRLFVRSMKKAYDKDLVALKAYLERRAG